MVIRVIEDESFGSKMVELCIEVPLHVGSIGNFIGGGSNQSSSN